MLQAFITSRLDSCNTLFCGTSDKLMQCLQSVQNAVTRLLTGTHQCDHISLVLCQLHRLPVWQCQDLSRSVKIATFLHWSMSGHEPSYMVDDCQLVTDSCVRQLPPADTRTLSSATEYLMLVCHKSGIVCQLNYSPGVHLRHFYLMWTSRPQCTAVWPYSKLGFTSTLTYLLTYLFTCLYVCMHPKWCRLALHQSRSSLANNVSNIKHCSRERDIKDMDIWHKI